MVDHTPTNSSRKNWWTSGLNAVPQYHCAQPTDSSCRCCHVPASLHTVIDISTSKHSLAAISSGKEAGNLRHKALSHLLTSASTLQSCKAFLVLPGVPKQYPLSTLMNTIIKGHLLGHVGSTQILPHPPATHNTMTSCHVPHAHPKHNMAQCMLLETLPA
jgi:hypothetical protein